MDIIYQYTENGRKIGKKLIKWAILHYLWSTVTVFFVEGNAILGHASQDVWSGNTKSMAEDDISKVSLGHYT